MLPPPSVPPLRIVGLGKRYGDTVALAGLDLEVPTGSCFGIVGPNGSGKTTTLRAIVGLVRPDTGRVEVHGIDAVQDPVAARRIIGAVLDPLALFERLTARELLVTLGELRGLGCADVTARSDGLFGALGLADVADRQISGYSHGMRKKTALAAALLHRPRLVLLDEPFEGVDPLSARAMRGLLDRFRRGGGTVVLSSHVMDLVDRLCDRLAVIHDGRVLRSGPTEVVRGGLGLEDAVVALVGQHGSPGVPADPSTEDRETLAWLG